MKSQQAAVTTGHSSADDLETFVARHRSRVVSDAWRALAWPATLFVALTIAVAVDLAANVANGRSMAHLVTEAFALLLALAGVVGTSLKLRSALRDGEALLSELEVTRLDLAHWRGESQARAGRSRPAPAPSTLPAPAGEPLRGRAAPIDLTRSST